MPHETTLQPVAQAKPLAGAISPKPKLLVLELWAVGDLIISTPFLRRASEHYDVTLVAKAFALDLQPRFWPNVRVVPFKAPWTAFHFNRKYRLYSWPWRTLASVIKRLRKEKFDLAVSARWDPRDHLLMNLTGARERAGFPRLGSGSWLTKPITPPDHASHRYEYWRTIGNAIGLDMPLREQLNLGPTPGGRVVVVHSGAAQPVRIWPIPRFAGIVRRLREAGYTVRVLSNPDNREEWLKAGETNVATPSTIDSLLSLMTDACAFIGNDSGPGHLAAFLGVPTFTLFGPMIPDWWAPLHPASSWIDGKPCPYKPCSDTCRFASPHCILGLGEAEVWDHIQAFLNRQSARSIAA